MDIAVTLLDYGAKANAESKAGFTPLHLSSQEGNVEMTNLLLNHNADPNYKSKVNYTDSTNENHKYFFKCKIYFTEWFNTNASHRTRRQT